MVIELIGEALSEAEQLTTAAQAAAYRERILAHVPNDMPQGQRFEPGNTRLTLLAVVGEQIMQALVRQLHDEEKITVHDLDGTPQS